MCVISTSSYPSSPGLQHGRDEQQVDGLRAASAGVRAAVPAPPHRRQVLPHQVSCDWSAVSTWPLCSSLIGPDWRSTSPAARTRAAGAGRAARRGQYSVLAMLMPVSMYNKFPTSSGISWWRQTTEYTLTQTPTFRLLCWDSSQKFCTGNFIIFFYDVNISPSSENILCSGSRTCVWA